MPSVPEWAARIIASSIARVTPSWLQKVSGVERKPRNSLQPYCIGLALGVEVRSCARSLTRSRTGLGPWDRLGGLGSAVAEGAGWIAAFALASPRPPRMSWPACGWRFSGRWWSLVVGYAVMSAYGGAIERREKAFLREAFGFLLAPDLD